VKDHVVLVHGIWATGLLMTPLRRRLCAAGFDARAFSYRSLVRTPAEVAEGLAGFLGSLPAGPVHLVAHSLGGLVVLHLAARGGLPRAGRVVFLGVPTRGSAVARILAARWPMRPLLGRSVEEGLLGGAPTWPRGRDLGLVAGTKAIGAGRLVTRLKRPNDGTVAVVETRVRGATDRLALPVSHTGLLGSRAVADAVASFLREGRFGGRSPSE
jgi:pimeloyl-ACP methyl ester carboxylesterase